MRRWRPRASVKPASPPWRVPLSSILLPIVHPQTDLTNKHHVVPMDGFRRSLWIELCHLAALQPLDSLEFRLGIAHKAFRELRSLIIHNHHRVASDEVPVYSDHPDRQQAALAAQCLGGTAVHYYRPPGGFSEEQPELVVVKAQWTWCKAGAH